MMMSGVISVTIGMLPAMKITEPYSPIARANASAKPVSSAGSNDGKDDAAEGLPARGAQRRRRFLELARSLQHRLHRAHDERQADEVSATRTPSGVNATLMPSGASHAPSQPLGA